MKHLTQAALGIAMTVGALTAIGCGGKDDGARGQTGAGGSEAAGGAGSGRSEGGEGFACDDLDVAAISTVTQLSLRLDQARQNPSGSTECTLWADDAGWVNVVVGSDAAGGRTGEPVSGVGDEAMSDGENMYARVADTEVWVRLVYGALDDDPNAIAPETVQSSLTETTRIVLDQATS
jgi:hypothetical protein